MKLYEKIIVGLVILFSVLLLFPNFMEQYIFFTLSTIILSLSYFFCGFWLFNKNGSKVFFIPIFAGISLSFSILTLPFTIIYELERSYTFHYLLILNILLVIILFIIIIYKSKKGGVTKNIKFIFIRAIVVLVITSFFIYSPITFKLYYNVMKCLNNYSTNSVNKLTMNYYDKECDDAINKGDCNKAIEYALKSNIVGKFGFGIVSEEYTNIVKDDSLLNLISNDSIKQLPEINNLFNTYSNKEELSKISNTYRNLYHAYACRADKEYNNNQINEALNDYITANKYLFACNTQLKDWRIEKSWSLNNIALCYRDLKKYKIANTLFKVAILYFKLNIKYNIKIILSTIRKLDG